MLLTQSCRIEEQNLKNQAIAELKDQNDNTEYSGHSEKSYKHEQGQKTLSESSYGTMKTATFQEQAVATKIDTYSCLLETDDKSFHGHTKVTMVPSTGSNFEGNQIILENPSSSLLLVAEKDNRAGQAVPKVILKQENLTKNLVTTVPNDETKVSSTFSSKEDLPMSTGEKYTSLLGQYEKLQVDAYKLRLEIAVLKIEKGLIESSWDLIIKQMGKLDSIEALEQLKKQYATST